MFSQPPPYSSGPAIEHPMTDQPQPTRVTPQPYPYGGGGPGISHAPGRPLTPPPGAFPAAVNPNPNVNGSGGNGCSGNGCNNTSINNSNNSSNTVVVNANVAASAGGGGNGNALCLITKDQLRGRSWNSGLFSCFNDFIGCALTTVCLPLSLVRLANRLNECACVACFVPGGIVALRTKLRTMGGIKGSICSDCVISHFCVCCVTCQMQREMDDMDI